MEGRMGGWICGWVDDGRMDDDGWVTNTVRLIYNNTL